MKNTKFKELEDMELKSIDGGFVIFGVTIAGMTLLKIAGTIAAAGLTSGITVGLNRVNRSQ